jgi:hypothetical protein
MDRLLENKMVEEKEEMKSISDVILPFQEFTASKEKEMKRQFLGHARVQFLG